MVRKKDGNVQRFIVIDSFNECFKNAYVRGSVQAGGGGGGHRRPLPPKIHEFQARSKAKTTEGGLAKW